MSLLRYERGWGTWSRRVYIATPVGDGKPFDNYVASLPNLATALARADIGMDFALESGNVHVDDARNSLARHFLTTDCADLVFIDADVGFHPLHLVRLLSRDRDIVGGAYPLKQDEARFPVQWLSEGRTAEADGCIEVAGMPTGFLRIERGVIETLADSAPKYRFGDAPFVYPLIFERKSFDGVRLGGDLAFCRKARDAGFKVYVDPDMTLTHTGQKVWEGNLADHLATTKGMDAPAFIRAMGAVRAGDASDWQWKTLFKRWGNPFSAPPELLSACWHAAREADGPILETGSGLTTLVMGLAAEQSGQRVYALEHDVDWYLKTRHALDRYEIKSVDLVYAPLDRYADEDDIGLENCWWYDTAKMRLPKEFRLVLLDGPQRRFGRDGLFALYGDRISNARWLMDDADDPQQVDLIRSYAPERLERMKIIESEAIPGRAFAALPRPKAAAVAAE